MDKAQHAEGLHRPGEAQQAPSKQPPRHFDLNEAAGSTDIGVDGSVAADGAKPPFSGPASSHGLKQGDAAQAGPKAPPTQVRHVGQAAPGGQWKTANGHNGVNGRAATGAKAERASAVPVAGGTQPRPAFRVSPPDPEVVDIDTDSEDGSETEEDAEDYTESETGSEAEEQEHARGKSPLQYKELWGLAKLQSFCMCFMLNPLLEVSQTIPKRCIVWV